MTLVGRSDEIAAVTNALADGERLVTLVGAGGVGKSALARAVLAGLDVHADGGFAAIVSCAEIVSPEALIDAIAEVLAISPEPATRAIDSLGQALFSRGPGVLLLDGLGPWPALAPTLHALLTRAVETALLVTGTTPVGLSAERLVEVGPLALPGPLDEPLSSPAVRCFVQAAGQVRAGYAPAASELPFVVEIVNLLDGHPLALELAAARLAVMGERALLHRLRQNLATLGPRASGMTSAEAALAGSWAALTPRERAVLSACAVFRGGFTLEAAEAIAPGEDTLDVLQSLRRQSLVRAASVSANAVGDGGGVRLSLYPLVRVFAAARLAASDQAATVEARHATYYSAGPPAPATPRARHVFALAERDNLLAVVDRVIALPLVSARAAEPALRALCLLGPLARFGGPTSAAFSLLAPALRATQGSGADPRLRAEVLALRAEHSRKSGQLTSAAKDLLEAAAIAQAVGEPWLVAHIDNQLAFLGAIRGELALAEEHHERAARVFAGLGRRAGEGDALRGLGAVLARRGDRRAARACLERALAAHRLAHDEAALAEDRLELGAMALDEGDVDAHTHFEAAAVHAHAAGDRALLARAQGALGSVAHEAGDLTGAAEAYARAALDLEALGHATAAAVFVGFGGIVARERGEAGEAYAQITTALDALGDDGERPRALLLRAHLAVLEQEAGRSAEAASLRAIIAAAPEPRTEPLLRAALAVLAGQVELGSPVASFHARIASRCVARQTASGPLAALPLPPEALLLGPGATWFRPPQGGRVSLERRRPMALLLDALVTARLAAPGRAVSSDELLAAAWPGERVLATAGAHRVRVAVASLRKLGLRELVQTIEPGYRLASDVITIRLG